MKTIIVGILILIIVYIAYLILWFYVGEQASFIKAFQLLVAFGILYEGVLFLLNQLPWYVTARNKVTKTVDDIATEEREGL